MLKGEKNKDTIQHVHEKREGEIKYIKKKKIGVGLGGGGVSINSTFGKKEKKRKAPASNDKQHTRRGGWRCRGGVQVNKSI